MFEVKSSTYLDWIKGLIQHEHTFIIFLLVLILIANIIDFLIGYLNAHFNKDINFSSSKAILGIVRKIGIYVLLVYFIPVVLILPDVVGIPALIVLFLGYLGAELKSIASHLGIGNDEKFGNIFNDFFTKLLGGFKNDK